MAGRRLSPEEREIWSKLTKTVHPLKGREFGAALTRAKGGKPDDGVGRTERDAAPVQHKKAVRGRVPPARPVPGVEQKPVPPSIASSRLDDSWERRIMTGAIMPEMSVDLHGHTLEAAHRRLNQTLGLAVAQGVRVLLIVTGNPRPAPIDIHGQRNRGAIRAEIGDWLALSGYAASIASVRTAHPRHGGRGALYIILRRRK